MTALTRSTLTAGTVHVTVTLPETFVLARRLLGEEWHDSYAYRVTRVEEPHGFSLYLHTLTAPRNPNAEPRWVYTGVVHPRTGGVTLTRSSAFPAHATRVRVADRVLRAIFAGRAADIEAAGWAVEVEVAEELAGRF